MQLVSQSVGWLVSLVSHHTFNSPHRFGGVTSELMRFFAVSSTCKVWAVSMNNLYEFGNILRTEFFSQESTGHGHFDTFPSGLRVNPNAHSWLGREENKVAQTQHFRGTAYRYAVATTKGELTRTVTTRLYVKSHTRPAYPTLNYA
jgi:hypothetical protein